MRKLRKFFGLSGKNSIQESKQASADQDPVKVAIHAALDPRTSGGVQTNLSSLVSGLRGYKGRLQVSLLTPISLKEVWSERIDPAYSALDWPYAFPWYREGKAQQYINFDMGLSEERDSALREQNIEVLHFPYQVAFQSSLPTIFEPWDLQHIHLPEYFSEGERAWRTDLFRRASEQATFIVTATAETKRDLVSVFGLQPEKIVVIYRPSNLSLSQTKAVSDAVCGVLSTGRPYAFFPAMMHAHKNHLRLIEAIAIIRDQLGEKINLVCSGRLVPSIHEQIEIAIRDYELEDQISFLGQVSSSDLTALYANARMLVFPSLFEGLGLPLLEAMSFDLPIAASNTSCIPEVTAGAAKLFDPLDPQSIAQNIMAVWTDRDLAQSLVTQGRMRAGEFSWTKASKIYNAVYHAAAGRKLDIEQTRYLDTARSI